MGDFERLYGFAERLGGRFRGMKRAIDVCTVRTYLFDLSEEDEKRLDEQWKGIVAAAAGEGGEVVQVQLCDTPVSDDMKAYLVETDAYFRTFGERLCVIAQDAFERMAKGWDLTDQFWVIDGKTAIVSSYAEDGELLGDYEITDAKQKREMARLSDSALAASLPVKEFIRRYG